MANQTGVTYPVKLSCGCVALHIIDGATHMECHLHGDRLITAFELREWHMSCGQCRSGKWTGKDKNAAYHAKTNHQARSNHFQIMVDFMVPERVKRTWKIHYGNRRTPARYMAVNEDIT